jgi:hypothetical protein
MADQELWILDEYGYDARGLNARVFSTVEKAKEASGAKKWKEPNKDGVIHEDIGKSLDDSWAIYPAKVDSKRYGGFGYDPDGPED